MKKKFQLIPVVLALLMVLTLLAGCGDQNLPEETESGSETVTNGGNTQEIDEAEAYKPVAEDLGGYVYRILASTNGATDHEFFYCTEQSMDTNYVSASLYARQQLLERELNVATEFTLDSDYMDTITVSAQVGDPLCDVIRVKSSDLSKLALRGALVNLLDQDAFNLDASYWDQRLIDEYRIDNILFALGGEIDTNDDMQTLVVMFNEKLWSDYGLTAEYGTAYQMVESMNWTYETMFEMTKGLGLDRNSDGKMDERDTYGMVTETYAPYYFFLGSGMKILNNQQGGLTYALSDSATYSQMYNALEELMQMSNTDDIMMANDGKSVSEGSVWTAGANVFHNDGALFRTTTLSAVGRHYDMVSNYSLLPIPASTEDQDGYYCWVSAGFNALGIYRYVDDTNLTARITEFLAYYSLYGTYTLHDAFYGDLATQRLCRNDDAYKMLDLIFSSKTYDVDSVFGITGIGDAYANLIAKDNYTALSSTLESLADSAELKLSHYVQKIRIMFAQS